MCGRFTLTLTDEDLERLFDAEAPAPLPPVPRLNICPTQDIAVVAARGEEGRKRSRLLQPMRWGFLPHWYKAPNDGPLLINARAEGVAEKPAFRAACRGRRCLVPASGFYEWTRAADGGKDPWYIYPAEQGAVLALAAIWQEWTAPEGGETLSTVAIVTTAANDALKPVHHRMPVIISPPDWPLWLGEAGKGAAPLMRPAADDALAMHRVSRRVNVMKADGPDLTAPINP
ncbi:SOS response-associated peptidase [Rhodobacteraceae bacterium 2CG4]|uniref:Abasic site processing protein n=1 Tax=Halovulum marinum TaxID=2662447 RepID=A0A6L5YWF7_9RHOB|nr:SOS response-associated peptidase [Halovulum marinum]MSU88656.1 SOS response-associated peptidase [Halovulum marinum]